MFGDVWNVFTIADMVSGKLPVVWIDRGRMNLAQRVSTDQRKSLPFRVAIILAAYRQSS
jgi:hypothetical protein